MGGMLRQVGDLSPAEDEMKKMKIIISSMTKKEKDNHKIIKDSRVTRIAKGSGTTETFTIRKMSGGTGVERIFPLSSPFIEKIVVNKEGAVRRARLFYLRERTGKAARIKEKKNFSKK